MYMGKNEVEQSKKEITWINSLKGIAIIGVIIVHSAQGSQTFPSSLKNIIAFGQQGVQIFILLSGFLSYMSYEKRVVNNLQKPFVWQLKKLIGILPVYYLCLVVYCVINNNQISVGNLISHIFLVFDFFPQYYNGIIEIAWYVSLLTMWDLILPIIYKLINSLEKSILSYVIISVICATILMIVNTNVDISDSNLWVYLNVCSPLVRFPIFFLGVMTYHFSRYLQNIDFKRKRLFSVSLLLLSMIFIDGEIKGINTVSYLGTYERNALWMVIFVMSISVYQWKVVDNKVFQKVGKNTYSIFLFHMLLVNFFDKTLSITNMGICEWGGKIIIICVVSYMFSLAIEKFYNKPVIKILNKMLERKIKENI